MYEVSMYFKRLSFLPTSNVNIKKIAKTAIVSVGKFCLGINTLYSLNFNEDCAEGIMLINKQIIIH
jgi:hypothetical protein